MTTFRDRLAKALVACAQTMTAAQDNPADHKVPSDWRDVADALIESEVVADPETVQELAAQVTRVKDAEHRIAKAERERIAAAIEEAADEYHSENTPGPVTVGAWRVHHDAHVNTLHEAARIARAEPDTDYDPWPAPLCAVCGRSRGWHTDANPPPSHSYNAEPDTDECVCTCGKPYPCDDDPHEWKPNERDTP